MKELKECSQLEIVEIITSKKIIKIAKISHSNFVLQYSNANDNKFEFYLQDPNHKSIKSIAHLLVTLDNCDAAEGNF